MADENESPHSDGEAAEDDNRVCDRCGRSGLAGGDLTTLANGERICPACDYQNIQDGE